MLGRCVGEVSEIGAVRAYEMEVQTHCKLPQIYPLKIGLFLRGRFLLFSWVKWL